MEDNDIQKINDVFNEQLLQQIAGTLKPGHVYKLGHPSDILITAIVEGLSDYFRDDFMENRFLTIENELQSKPQYNSVDVRKQLISAAKIIESFISSKDS